MATLTGGANNSFLPDAKKASLGTGVIGEAIMSLKPNQIPGLKPRPTKLPSLPPKRQSQHSPSQLSMYKTQSMNPYRALVAAPLGSLPAEPMRTGRRIGIHHCSIEFNGAASLKPAIHVASSSLSITNAKTGSQTKLLSQSS